MSHPRLAPPRIPDTHDEALNLIEALEATLDDMRERADGWPDCRCGRPLLCRECRNEAGECDCSRVDDDMADEFDPDDPGTDDPLARTLLGLPSGIHCHDGEGRCLSGHCSQGVR